MHIEPGIVAGPKMALAHGTAAAAAAYTARLAIDDLRTHGLASFALRTVIAAIGVFISFEVMPHFAVGISEVHFIFGTTLFLILGAAPAAIGLALVVRAMGSSSHQPSRPAVAAVETRPMTRVLVAATDLQPGKRLGDADMAWKDWPSDEVNPAFIVDGPAKPPADGRAAETAAKVARAATEATTGGTKGEYVGSVVRETILKGEPIVARKIVRAGDSGYLAAYLEPGMRAMAISVTVETAAGGFILPGDRVDVVMTREFPAQSGGGGTQYSTSTVMRNIKVLAIDQTTRAADDEQAVVGATATLEVTPGDAEALAKAEPALKAYSKAIQHMGPAGSGQLTKMVNQIAIAGVVQGLAEAVHFAQVAGLDTDKAYDAVSKGAAQSWQMDNRWKTAARGEFDFGFAVDWMRKDLGLVLDEAKRNGARLPVTALVDQFYADVQDMGGGRWDTSSLKARLPGPDGA